jgi:hypothetical protein
MADTFYSLPKAQRLARWLTGDLVLPRLLFYFLILVLGLSLGTVVSLAAMLKHEQDRQQFILICPEVITTYL